jgi:methionyl-tRNA formyltransferase
MKMDAGPILRQEEYVLQGNEKAPEVLSRMFERGLELLVEALPSVWGSSAVFLPQRDEDATLAAKISAAEAKVDFSESSAVRRLHAQRCST